MPSSNFWEVGKGPVAIAVGLKGKSWTLYQSCGVQYALRLPLSVGFFSSSPFVKEMETALIEMQTCI